MASEKHAWYARFIERLRAKQGSAAVKVEGSKSRWQTLRENLLPGFAGRMSLQVYLLMRGWIYCSACFFVLLNSICIKIIRIWGSETTDNVHKCVAIVLACYMLLLLLSVNARRLHDIGCSGWWVLSPFFMAQKFYMGIEEEGEPGANAWGMNQMELQGKGCSAAEPLLSRSELQALYRRAARKNDHQAQFELCRRYFYGQGIVQNKALAVRWGMKAWDAGLEDAHHFFSSLSETPKS